MKGVRHVDFNAPDWVAETFNLSIGERGLYLTAWELICLHGGPVSREDLRGACPGDKRPYTRALERLLELGKLIDVNGTHLDQPRCEVELERARKRIETSVENGSKSRGFSAKNARKSKPVSSQNKDLENPAGPLYAREPLPPETNYKEEDARSSSEPRARESPPRSSPKNHQGYLLTPIDGGVSASTAHSPNGGKRNGQTGIPLDWSLSPDQREYARHRGWDDQRIDSEFEIFRNHYIANGKLRADWPAAWCSWVGRDEHFNGHRGTASGAGPGDQGLAAVIRRRRARRQMAGGP